MDVIVSHNAVASKVLEVVTTVLFCERQAAYYLLSTNTRLGFSLVFPCRKGGMCALLDEVFEAQDVSHEEALARFTAVDPAVIQRRIGWIAEEHRLALTPGGGLDFVNLGPFSSLPLTTEGWEEHRALLAGRVLHAEDVTAGNGSVVDWRTVKSGETVHEGDYAFDTARVFVACVGSEAAIDAVARAGVEVPDPPPAPRPTPRVTAYAMTARGGRRRSFDVGDFTIHVEPHEDDARQAAFAERLAELAAGLA